MAKTPPEPDETTTSPRKAKAHGARTLPLVALRETVIFPEMIVPLQVLALGSIVAGLAGWPAALWGSNWIEHFLHPVFADAHHALAEPSATRWVDIPQVVAPLSM